MISHKTITSISHRSVIGLAVAAAVATCLSAPASSQAAVPDPRVGKLMVVDCLLPGQVRQLGGRTTYLTPRRPVKTTAGDCEIRGGEYVAFDRANYATSLKIWLPQAKAGDPKAQTYVGEIFEKGLGTQPDYSAAASWYKKAADQGYARAEIDLGSLYEQGLGVPQDMRKAMNWYRRASGLKDNDLQFASSIRVSMQAKEQKIQQLQQRSERSEKEAAELKRQLQQARAELNGRKEELKKTRDKLNEIREQLKKQQDATGSKSQAGLKKRQEELDREESRLKDERDQLAKLKADLAARAQALSASDREAAERNNQLQSRLLQEQADADRLRDRLKQVNQELDKSQAALGEGQEASATMLAQLQAARSEQGSLKKELKDRDGRIQDLKKRLDTTKGSLDKAAASYAEAMSKLQNRETLHDVELERIKAERDRVARERDQLAKQSAKDTQHIKQLKAKLEERESSLKSQGDQLAKLKSDLAARAKALSASDREAAERNNQLQSELLKKRADVQQLRDRLAQVNQELDKSRASLSEGQEASATLLAQLQAAQSEQDSLKSELKDRGGQVEDLQKRLDAAKGRLDKAALGYADAMSELEHREALHEAELARVKADRDRLAQERNQLAQQSTRNVEHIKQLRAKLEKEEAAYKSKLATLEQQYAKSQQKLKQAQDKVAAGASTKVAMADAKPPAIDLIEPPVTLTRSGEYTAEVQEGLKSRDVVGKIEAPAGVKEFNVNQRPVKIDNNGLFKVSVPIKSDPRTPVSMVVIDNLGRRVSLDIDLFRQLAQNGASGSSATDGKGFPYIKGLGKYFALVIGNSDYQDFPPLHTPTNDARAVAKVLKDEYGYKTKLILNATRYKIISALNDYRKNLNHDDNLLIYYAGHGALDSVNNLAYWLPVDAEKDNTANWISTRSISDILNVMTAKHVLIVADSCYSGALTRSALARLQGGKTVDEWVKWFKKVAEMRTRMVLSSGGDEPVNDGGGGSHSLFAKAFLEALKDNHHALDGYRFYLEISKLVKASIQKQHLAVKQTPEYAPIKFAGHEAGDFIFQPT